jgi:electron transfer flavoprotein alpha subunit
MSEQAELLVVVEPGVDPAGPSALALGAEAARLAGALRAGLRCVTWPADTPAPIESVADALAELMTTARPVAVLLLDTDTSRQLAPMVAHRRGGGAVVGCSDVVVHGLPDATAADGRDGPPLSFCKPVYGGWLQREVRAADGAGPVVTLDLAGIETPTPDTEALADPQVLDLKAVADPAVRHLETVPPDARSVDLVHARRIVAAGVGATGDDLLAAVGELADLLQGSVGATRPVTDDGRLPKERLIGQTGRSVAPDLYVALGVSGSPHHVAGVRSADRVLSVNRDVRAPIFQFSDVGYVADLEEVLPALVRRISEWRDEPADA